MKISDTIWSTLLDEGGTLGEKVLTKPPTVRRIEADSLTSFLTVWKNRLEDALASKNQILEARARAILGFAETNQHHTLALLLWSEHGLSGIYDATTGELLIFE